MAAALELVGISADICINGRSEEALQAAREKVYYAALTFTQATPASLLQRYATTEEIANLICYACSKASSATNGAVLQADGGIVASPF